MRPLWKIAAALRTVYHPLRHARPYVTALASMTLPQDKWWPAGSVAMTGADIAAEILKILPAPQDELQLFLWQELEQVAHDKS